MLNPFVCGTFNPEDDELCLANPDSSSPKKYKRKNNPYSTRGLDKFSALLSDLNEKRQKIYSQMNPHDISFVRFVHSNTDDFVPIIVKVKNKDQKHMKSQEVKVAKARNLTESTTAIDQPMEETKQQTKLESDEKARKKRLLSVSWNMNIIDMEKPVFYLPFVVILILVLLTLFGRSVATIFTCVLWYVIPTLKEYYSSSNTRRLLVKNKEHVRGVSEKKMVVSSNNEEVSKKKEYVRGCSEKKMVVSSNNEGVSKKKEYVRGFSEKKMVVSEGIKKKDYVRRLSEKKMATDGLLSSSPRSGGDDSSEANSKNKIIQAKHSHKKSW